MYSKCAASYRGTCDRWYSVRLHRMDGFVVVRHGTSEREGDLVLLMVGWIGVLLVAIFITQLDRISGYASARTADVLLHAAAEHGSGVLVADNARLDLFVDATAVHGRRAAGSDVLRRTDAVGSNAFVLWGVAVGFLVLLLSSGFKAGRTTDAPPTSVTGD
ncbi:hypothetical protein [Paenibacillus taichungensis]|uniref:hypothetical protein n=1 Tax=Paenibacillus taichungensis TaxID=484184 RepID=UPI002871BC40|nr:hypothetical protein [Paenibacillus taichungensis]MDR9746029.1 hypothetical protein [Paenibacillus taichungensis]